MQTEKPVDEIVHPRRHVPDATGGLLAAEEFFSISTTTGTRKNIVLGKSVNRVRYA